MQTQTFEAKFATKPHFLKDKSNPLGNIIMAGILSVALVLVFIYIPLRIYDPLSLLFTFLIVTFLILSIIFTIRNSLIMFQKQKHKTLVLRKILSHPIFTDVNKHWAQSDQKVISTYFLKFYFLNDFIIIEDYDFSLWVIKNKDFSCKTLHDEYRGKIYNFEWQDILGNKADFQLEDYFICKELKEKISALHCS